MNKQSALIFRTQSKSSDWILIAAIQLLGWALISTPLLGSPECCASPANHFVQDEEVQSNDESDQNESVKSANRAGILVKVPLPVTSKTADQIRLTLKQIVEKAPQVIRPTDRTVVVLEFDTNGGRTGRGSELEACQSLARYLGTADMNRIETIAYIPADANDNQGIGTQLSGHAVLIAIAADQLAMDVNASIGNAGIDESNIDALIKAVYSGIASQRLTLPVPIVMAMLNKQTELYRVQTDEGTVYADSAELENLEEKGKAEDTKTISKRGQTLLLTSQQLLDFRLIRHRVSSRNELSRDLDLIPNSLNAASTFAGQRTAVRIELPPFVDQRTSQWVSRSLNRQLSSSNPPNLIIFNIDGNTGDVDACLSLARYLVDLDSDVTQTVAYLRGSAKGPLGLIALSCDQITMASESRLGGHTDLPVDAELSDSDLDDIRPMIKAIARDKQEDWSLMMAMLDPGTSVTRYRHIESGQLRLLSPEEMRTLDDADKWAPLGPVDVDEGITAAAAEQMYVSGSIADDFDQFKSLYQIKEDPKTLKPSASDRWVERFATFLTSPMITFLLLVGGMSFLSTEMSAPGLGIPGFLSALCFMLFFWSQHLGGNAHWFEIIMFVAGMIFIAMEIFVIPGFGVFGIGGLIMVGLSLVLASQDFIIPQTTEQFARLPQSLLPLVGAGLGFFVTIFALRKVLPNSPYFNRMMLSPRDQLPDTGLETRRDPEAVVDWSYLNGESGETITRLFPAGKARINGRVYDVITDGRMVDKGTKVTVVEAVANRVVVKPVDVG